MMRSMTRTPPTGYTTVNNSRVVHVGSQLSQTQLRGLSEPRRALGCLSMVKGSYGQDVRHFVSTASSANPMTESQDVILA